MSLETPAPALQLKNLTKSYGTSRGITNINLEIQEGEVFGFLGPNGAGKSTTINTILDLLRPTSGSVSVFGLDAHRDSVGVHRRIGYLSGDMETDSSLTGKQYLQYAANLRGGVGAEKIAALVARLRCQDDKKIKHLSRGNRQKIGLVAALMHDPDMLILDEPTSGLDPLVQNEFNDIISEYRAAGKTVFMSSHVLSEVQAVCDRVGFIRGSELIRVSALEELMAGAPRMVTVTYKDAVPAGLKSIAGVRNFTPGGTGKVEFTYSGDYNALITSLGAEPIADLQIVEPQLEELFMEYYQADGPESEPAAEAHDDV